MTPTRNNHYVPQWYQEGFFIPGRTSLAYLDLNPIKHPLPNGRYALGKALFDAPTARAFLQKDLYTTFFGASLSDDIERRLFGDIDTRGSKAVRCFANGDAREWHENFKTFFEYIDIQKIRTPKGLDWLRKQYPNLTQNELMREMQGIRMMHCTIWAESVREIVSAKSSEVKFIVSDHPVTIYNHAISPTTALCTYPSDPSIALKSSQTIFPLNQDFCLILTNLEYVRDPSANPLEKRTFARHFRNSLVRTDAFIRTRDLSSAEVVQINYIIKMRARRHIAAGCKEWLYPEKEINLSWSDLKQTLLPKKRDLIHFGGEIFAHFDDGSVHYQDEFGRTEKRGAYLRKAPLATVPRALESCRCGSGLPYGNCCSSRPESLRPSWQEKSIRERNIMLFNAITNVLDLDDKKDWVQIRREVTDYKISEIYSSYAGLWPLETDLLSLLPKPDGLLRAVYTGLIHPYQIRRFAVSAPLYFGPTIIQHPFIHPGSVNSKFSPVDNPHLFRSELLKAVLIFLMLFPLVHAGIVNLVPDPCVFDSHLQRQLLRMARSRSGSIGAKDMDSTDLEAITRNDIERNLMSLPERALRSLIMQSSPEITDADLEATIAHFAAAKIGDPLAVIQAEADQGEPRGQFSMMTLAPNFEMSLYLAQATGSCIVTDDKNRWNEFRRTQFKPAGRVGSELSNLAEIIAQSSYAISSDPDDVAGLYHNPSFVSCRAAMRDSFKYLSRIHDGKRKPNVEEGLKARFLRSFGAAQSEVRKSRLNNTKGEVASLFPAGGIQDHTVNRLLLMSNSENHLPAVPMAFYIRSKHGSD